MAALRIKHRMVAQSPSAGTQDCLPGWKSRTETGLAVPAYGSPPARSRDEGA